MFIITTDHAGIPDIVEDGINGIVMKNDEYNIYNRMCFSVEDVKNVCARNDKNCREKYTEKKYKENIKAVFMSIH